MDNLTHSLFALTLAQTPLRRAGRGTTLTLLLASNAPDSDIVAVVTGDAEAYLGAHRAISHGPLGVTLLALIVATLVYGGLTLPRWRRRGQGSRPAAASLLSLVGLAIVGTIGHVLMDLPTSYGTRVFSPFDWTWYAVDWMPIIDVYLWGLLLAGFIAIRIRPNARTWSASLVLLLMTVNYGLRAGVHGALLDQVTAADAVPPPTVSTWPDAPVPKLPSDYVCLEPPCALRTAVLPTFESPFRWRVIRQYSNGYRLSDIDFFTRTEQLLGWEPHDETPAVESAREAPAARALLAFSRFPVANVVPGDEDAVVSIHDIRFVEAPVLRPYEALRPRGLFTVIIRLDTHGRILEHRLGR